MREIKCRQPVFVRGKFSHWHYWGFIDGGFIGPDCSWAKNKQYQFTGLKDKNGREIYEGDIVSDNDEEIKDIIVVKYGLQFVDEFLGIGFNLWLFKGRRKGRKFLDYEIIGDVYENPELLK